MQAPENTRTMVPVPCRKRREVSRNQNNQRCPAVNARVGEKYRRVNAGIEGMIQAASCRRSGCIFEACMRTSSDVQRKVSVGGAVREMDVLSSVEASKLDEVKVGKRTVVVVLVLSGQLDVGTLFGDKRPKPPRTGQCGGLEEWEPQPGAGLAAVARVQDSAVRRPALPVQCNSAITDGLA